LNDKNENPYKHIKYGKEVYIYEKIGMMIDRTQLQSS